MSTNASALALHMFNQADEDILEAMILMMSARPHLRPRVEEASRQDPAPRVCGVIKTFYPEKGYGFIASDQVKAEFNEDTFLSDLEIGNFTVGSHVIFTVVTNKTGRPQARLLEQDLLTSPEISKAQPVLAQNGIEQHGDRHLGTIQAFFPEKRYGFIKSETVFAQFGCDTFLSDLEVGPFAVGSEITFSVVANSKGKPQARQLAPKNVEGGRQLVPGPDSWGKASARPMPKQWEDPWSSAQAVQPPAKIARKAEKGGGGFAQQQAVSSWTTQNPNKRFVGTISTYIPEKNFGFIQCPELHEVHGVDVFLSSHEVGEFTTGCEVAFRMELNKKGQPQARDLKDPTVDFNVIGSGLLFPDNSAADKAPMQGGGLLFPARIDTDDAGGGLRLSAEDKRYTGVIKSFLRERRYGFITSQEVTDEFGTDAFLSVNEIGAFDNGSEVSFLVRMSAKTGKPQASDLLAA
jgi:cold shock CspA family protein